MTTFRVKLVDFGADANFAGGDDSEHEIIYENVAQGEWISYQIPLTDFVGLNATDHMAQLIFSGLPAGQGALYVDNVYYSKDPVGVNDLADFEFKIFPNPAVTHFKIETEKEVETVEVFNLLGERLLTVQNQSTVNIGHLPRGTYLIKATIDEAFVVEKLIKN